MYKAALLHVLKQSWDTQLLQQRDSRVSGKISFHPHPIVSVSGNLPQLNPQELKEKVSERQGEREKYKEEKVSKRNLRRESTAGTHALPVP